MRRAGDRRDEDGGGEEDTNRDFLGKASIGGGPRVDEQKPRSKEGGQQRVEMESADVNAVQEIDQQECSYTDEAEKLCAMEVMEVMAGFEVVVVEQTVGGVDHPDGDEHGCRRGPRKRDAGTSREEPGPESCDRGSVEREKMPECEW